VTYRMWANTDRTVFVRLWDDGEMEICHEHPDLGFVAAVVLEEVEPVRRQDPPGSALHDALDGS
jgi:hypothetical protein